MSVLASSKFLEAKVTHRRDPVYFASCDRCHFGAMSSAAANSSID
jgi:hypothetical protein